MTQHIKNLSLSILLVIFISCNKKNIVKPDIESGTWNVIITEKYTGKKCTHDKKHRNNCRRGKIEVFDHNKKLVLTISDCLLEVC